MLKTTGSYYFLFFLHLSEFFFS